MAQYIVKPSQNIFDVALHLYGSIEGLFDLLMSNENLNMTSDLQTGQVLEYHDSFVLNESVVRGFSEQAIVPSNSERHVYLKHPSEPLVCMFEVIPDSFYVKLKIGGEGDMIIDWGDNSELERVRLSHTVVTIEHYFDNVSERRQLKLYGNPLFTILDTSEVPGNILPLRPLVVDEYVSLKNGFSIIGLFLFEGTYKVDLRGCSVSDLSPIAEMSLQDLDLRKVYFTNVSVLDDYLEYIANNYGTRRNCTVYLDTEPTSRGMSAIDKIIHEPEWNASGLWKFVIKDKIYTA